MHKKIHPTDYQKSFHVYFLMGQPEVPDEELESKITDELKLGDIIEYDQIDSYRLGSSKHPRTCGRPAVRRSDSDLWRTVGFWSRFCIPDESTLPDKTFAGYQFVAEHCTSKEYVLFVDDDTFLKLNEIKAEMKKMSPKIDSLRCLKGKCITGEDRANYLSKYFLWVDTYPHKYFIPRYSNGQDRDFPKNNSENAKN